MSTPNPSSTLKQLKDYVRKNDLNTFGNDIKLSMKKSDLQRRLQAIGHWTDSPSKTKRKKKMKKTKKKTKTKKKSQSKTKTLKVLSEDQQYNIYIICKNKTIFKDRIKTFQKYKGKIHKFTYVPAVFLKDTAKNRKLTQKLNTRHNTLMKNRLRKLGCIFAHRNALRKIVKAKTDHNLILEEDATLADPDHDVLPTPPKKDAYMGGWIIPPQITLAGKKKVNVPNLKSGLNEINYGSFSVLMAHSYYLRRYQDATKVLDVIEGPKKIKNYDIFLINHKFINQFYYPAIFVQSQHMSAIDGKVNKNDMRTKNYGLNLVK